MKNHLNFIFIAFFFPVVFISCQNAKVLYVSPDGNDKNPGTFDQPLASPQKAIELAKTNNIKNIRLRGGNYYGVNIELGKEDSGLRIGNYKNEHPVLYGGMLIKNWVRQEKFLTCKLEKSLDVRFLTVNNEPRPRSRLPENGAFTHLNEWNVPWMSTSGGGWKIQPTVKDLTTLKYDPKDIGSWLNVKNAEVTIFHFWDESQVGLKNVDTAKHILEFNFPATHPPGAFANRNKRAATYVIWNVREGLKRPGQWFFNKEDQTIYYWPLENEDPQNLNVVVPLFNNIITFHNGAKDIRIENIRLSTTSTPLINPGYSAHFIDGAIIGENLKNIQLLHLVIDNHAGWGVRMKEGRNISIKNCIIRNVGAGGIYFKGDDVKVDSCQIHDVGLLYNGSVGIEGGGGEHNQISHCDIFNIPYCGIGGVGKKSVVSDCLIYNFKTFLSDGGAIYQFSGDSTVYRNNVAICDPDKKIEGWTYYFDERSKDCIAENNLALNTIVPMHNHMADNILFKNNIFIDRGKQELSNYLCSNVKFENNISIADSIYLIAPRKGLVEEMNFNDSDQSEVRRKFTHATGFVSLANNIFYSRRQKLMHKEIIFYQPFKITEVSPADGNIFSDPGFENIAEGDFNFHEGSAASRMGINKFDFSGVGCTGSFKKLYKKFYE